MAMFWTDIYQNIIFVETKKTICCRYIRFSSILVAELPMLCISQIFATFVFNNWYSMISEQPNKKKSERTKWAQTHAQIRCVYVFVLCTHIVEWFFESVYCICADAPHTGVYIRLICPFVIFHWIRFCQTHLMERF